MNKIRILIASVALLSLGIAGRSIAQTPTPRTPPNLHPDLSNAPSVSSLVDWVSGEIRLNGGPDSWNYALTCGPASKGKGYSYDRWGIGDEVILQFSFGRSLSGPAIGSWIIRRAYIIGSGNKHSQTIMAGCFSDGSVALRRVLLGRSRGEFNLTGEATLSDGYCFSAPKSISIRGNCNRQAQGVTLQVSAGDQVYATGTFATDVNLSCGTGPESGVDKSLYDCTKKH